MDMTLVYIKTSVFANALPIDQYGHGYGYQKNRYEAEKRVPPPKTQRTVHGKACQWNQGADDGAPDCVGGEGGSGVDGEGVEEVGLDGDLGWDCQIG